MKITTPSWSTEEITASELLKFLSKAERLNYRYYISQEEKEIRNEDDDIFWICLETEYGEKYIKLNQSNCQCSTSHYSLKELNNFLDEKLKERLDTVERERKMQKLLQKLTPEEKELLGVL
jgi:hypothetical protein